MPRHFSQLPSTYTGVVAGQDQRFVVAALLFAAFVIGICEPPYCSGGQRERPKDGEQPSSPLACTGAQLSDRTNTATPVTRGQGIPQLHDVLLRLTGTEAKLVETGGSLFELGVILINLAQRGVVLVLADATSIQMLTQLLDLAVQLGHGRPGRIDCPQ
ncbi:hypothetical protein D3C84_530500 [compost metagenome]